MLASTVLTSSKLNLSGFFPPHAPSTVADINPRTPRSRVATFSKSKSKLAVVARVSSNSRDGAVDATSQQSSTPSGIDAAESTSSGLGDGYVALFVRMLGLDHDPLDREQAIIALWKYSLGGKKCIDTIMQFPGCINLIVNLLRSESSSACEAAAGLLRSLSSVNLCRNSVADSGAIEEISRLLRHSSLALEVKEQSLSTIWNLSVDEKLCIRIANSDILLLSIKYLDDEDMKVKEAAGGILANLALSCVNHSAMVEAGVITKLAKFLSSNSEGSKVLKKEARNALLELVKDDYYIIIVIEEGLVPVPMIGAAAYKSFTPGLHEWPTLPDGTEIERTSRQPSKFGASELLLGLNIDVRNANIEEEKINAILGRTQQQFLARIGAIERESNVVSHSESSNDQRLTLLPWVDGVARLVLILELEDKSAVIRAAESIAGACINEHMRIAFKEAGAIKHLIRLLDCDHNAVQFAVIQALERLSASNVVCRVIEVEGALGPLVSILKCSEIAGPILEKVLNWMIVRCASTVFEHNCADTRAQYRDAIEVNGSEKTSNGANNNDPTGGLRSAEQAISKANCRNNILDFVFIAHLVEIMRSSSPTLQEKAASVLEFVALADPTMGPIIAVDIESGLTSVFQQNILKISANMESDVKEQFSEAFTIEFEEAGLAISAASRLMTRLLNSDQFRHKINLSHFVGLLREILWSNIPVKYKGLVAACLVKLSSLSGCNMSFNEINVEVTLYETIPRLLEQITNSFSPEAQENAVVELNRIISEGVVDSTGAIISEGAIYHLVKLIEEGSDRAVQASLAILCNISMDSENHPALVAAGAVPALRRLILSHRTHWERALLLFKRLQT